jgi:hypothetical protein
MDKYYLNYFWIDIPDEERDHRADPPNLNKMAQYLHPLYYSLKHDNKSAFKEKEMLRFENFQ